MISRSKEKVKVKVEREIFTKHTGDNPLKWSDIKHLDLQDDDEIHARWEEPYYSENNSYDGHFYSVIIRHELETDEEFQSRIKRIERESEDMRKRRYETYLKLRQEFEGEEKKKFLMDNELITFLALCQDIEEEFKENQACILVKAGTPGGRLSIRKIYSTMQDFRDKAYDYIRNLDTSLQVDFEIYEFD